MESVDLGFSALGASRVQSQGAGGLPSRRVPARLDSGRETKVERADAGVSPLYPGVLASMQALIKSPEDLARDYCVSFLALDSPVCGIKTDTVDWVGLQGGLELGVNALRSYGWNMDDETNQCSIIQALTYQIAGSPDDTTVLRESYEQIMAAFSLGRHIDTEYIVERARERYDRLVNRAQINDDDWSNMFCIGPPELIEHFFTQIQGRDISVSKYVYYLNRAIDLADIHNAESQKLILRVISHANERLSLGSEKDTDKDLEDFERSRRLYYRRMQKLNPRQHFANIRGLLDPMVSGKSTASISFQKAQLMNAPGALLGLFSSRTAKATLRQDVETFLDRVFIALDELPKTGQEEWRLKIMQTQYGEVLLGRRTFALRGAH